MKKPELFDVVAVNLDSNVVRLLDSGKTRENAEAIVKFAVMRRGLDEEFFAEVPMGQYRNGDQWSAK